MKCAGCLKIVKDINAIKCTSTACEKSFCSQCINITGLSGDKKKCWRCPDCCSAQKKGGDNTLTPIRTATDVQNVTMRKKADSQSESSGSDLKEVTEQLRRVTQQLEEVTKSLNYSHDRLEELVTAMNLKDKRIQYLEKRDQELTTLKSEVALLKSELNIQFQQRLSNEIEIVGLPENAAENLQHTIKVTALKLGVDLDETDVDWVTRVGARHPPRTSNLPEGNSSSWMPRPVVVRLLRKSKRDQLLNASKSRRNISSADLNLPGNPLKVYLNERLTKENRMLFRIARLSAKKEGYAYCWCNQGSIYIRQREGKPAIVVRSQTDLDRILGNGDKADPISNA